MLVPNRNYSSPSYRYGFNGKEKDDEVKGSGNNYNFGSRTAYDPRIARFSSVDPRVRQYPSMSPYAFAANNPIYYEDQEGEGPIPFRFKKYLKQDSYYATGLLAGIGDGLIETLDMAAGVVQAGSAWNPFNAYAYTQEASQMRAEHREMGNMVIKLFSNEELRDKMYANIKKEVGDWFDQTTFQGTVAEAGYQHGKILFDVLTSVVGVSEIKYLLKTGEFTLSGKKLLNVWKKAQVIAKKGTALWKKLAKPKSIANILKHGAASKFKGKSGIYIHYMEDGSLYVGKAKNLGSRPRQSLNELLGLGKKEAKTVGKDYSHTEFYEFDGDLYKNLDHMEGDILNNKFGGKDSKTNEMLNKKQTDNWDDYK